MRSLPATPIRRIRVLKSTESSSRGSRPPTRMWVGGSRCSAASGAKTGERSGSRSIRAFVPLVVRSA